MSPIVLSACQLVVAAALLAGIVLVPAGVALIRHLDRKSTAAGR